MPNWLDCGIANSGWLSAYVQIGNHTLLKLPVTMYSTIMYPANITRRDPYCRVVQICKLRTGSRK